MIRPAPMALFALATLTPVVLFAAGLTAGGWWIVSALVYMTALVAVLDQAVPLVMPDAPEAAEFPGADALLVVLGIAGLGVLVLAVRVIAGPSGLSLAERIAAFVAVGLFLGQVAVPVAHELIHRGDRRLFRLGALIYVAILFGHHTSAHRLVHHRHAASPADPNSARSGETYYGFALRAWAGSFRQGMAAESARPRRGLHPYVWYVGGAALALALAWGLAGWPGVFVWAGLGAHAQSQLLLSDYVQHYGLARAEVGAGRLEPVGPQHSWNAPQWFSSGLMLNAPRHSDHHAHPARPYPALRLPGPDQAPRLPWPLPLACTIALFPPIWKRAIRPHLAPWRKTAQPLAKP